MSVRPETGERKHAVCPKCGSSERHRIQYLAFKEICKKINTKTLRMLHFAPEDFFTRLFRRRFKIYVTADLYAENVDRKEDLTRLSFNEAAFDVIYASHVLEHIKEDRVALSEIRRVLRPNGIAILPVPIIGKKTIEYPAPNPHDSGHIRCPGMDYYERYKEFFAEVKLYRSSDFNEKYQLYLYEDRTAWPDTIPLRPLVPGERHEEIVPVCYK